MYKKGVAGCCRWPLLLLSNKVVLSVDIVVMCALYSNYSLGVAMEII